MIRPKLEVADIFRVHGKAWLAANAGHLSPRQKRVMNAIQVCRTAELGGHVECCQDCAHTRVAYNSCRDRHCPKCQRGLAKQWLEAREAELLPVPYFHLVFRLPAALGPIALQNRAVVYGLLLKAAGESLSMFAEDRKHLGAKVGVIAALHTWGGDLQHHAHVHCIVPGGGISADHQEWVPCKPTFLRHVRQLSDLFRKLILNGLIAAFDVGDLHFYGELVGLNELKAFAAVLTPLRTTDWGVYAKEASDGPNSLLAYLAQYTHCVAITNDRLIEIDETHVTFRRKGQRESGTQGKEVARLKIDEFLRRFLSHVLPNGFQRIRYYGFLANGRRAEKLALCRRLLEVERRASDPNKQEEKRGNPSRCVVPPCPCCGGRRMRIIETFDGSRFRSHHVRKLDGL
jgi:hypothetical protein